MPELPEVEALRLSLLDLIGQTVSRVRLNRADLRYPLPRDLDAQLRNRSLGSIQRKGKTLLWSFDHVYMISHLGMSGSFRKQEGQEKEVNPTLKHDHVEWRFIDPGSKVVTDLIYNDPRRFGFIHLRMQCEEAKALMPRGIDPFDPGLSDKDIFNEAQHRRCNLKAFLLDQNFMAGIGNIYASEILWHANLSPMRPANELNRSMAKDLLNATMKTLNQAIEANGTTLRNHIDADGFSGMYHNHFVAYSLTGTPCHRRNCSGVIGQCTQHGRRTYYCPKHQI